MALRLEAGAFLDMRDLAPQIWYAVRRARIGARGEQTDEPVLSDEISARIEPFHADVVEIDAPVHARLDVGFGDDERARLLQERHDLRRKFHALIAAPQNAQFARAHDAERVLVL